MTNCRITYVFTFRDISNVASCVLKQVVQDSCRLLALQDVSLLSSSVSKLIKAVQMLPRLERFVNRSVTLFDSATLVA